MTDLLHLCIKFFDTHCPAFLNQALLIHSKKTLESDSMK